MSSSVNEVDPRAIDVLVSSNELTVPLADGRRISAPLVWFPRLLHATEEQLSEWELLGNGEGVRRAEVDEDLSVRGLLWGTLPPESAPPTDG